MIQYDVSDRLCVLRLDAPPVNAITYALLDELRAAMARANADADVRAIVLTGGARQFSAGADVSLFAELATAEDAAKCSRVFQEAFQQVEDSPKPVAAAVAGKVMGSALELAMACHFRVCAAGTQFSMPEVNFAINPGAGGTARLPRLVGADTALTMLLTGKPIDAAKALDQGLVDAVCKGDDLVDCARGLLGPEAAPRKTGERDDKVQDAAANQAAFAKAQELAAKARPEIIAPARIIEAVRAGIEDSFQGGLRKEQEIFAEIMATLPPRNKIYQFLAIRATAKVPELADAAPAAVAKAAVIGMGTMGTGIAQALIMGGVPVVVRDESDAAVEKGMARITKSIQKSVSRGKITEEKAQATLGRLSAITGWEGIAEADLVIEAVFENLDTKRAVLAHLEEICPAKTILATNTSTINLDALAGSMQHPERFLGVHFFNPAQAMPLVEIITHDGTDTDVAATAFTLAKTIRKTPVLCRNREGFLVNRVFLPYVKEAFFLLEEGADAHAIDAAMVDFGFPMGPLAVIDFTGVDIQVLTDPVMNAAFPHHGAVSPIAVRLVEQGCRGQKTGAGVFQYVKGDYSPHPSETTAAVIADVQKDAGITPREIGKDEIIQRLVMRTVVEGFALLEEGVALRETDLDAAMALGTGFPDFRGGVVKHARDLGIDNVVTQLEQLAAQVGERYAPCALLREMKGTS